MKIPRQSFSSAWGDSAGFSISQSDSRSQLWGLDHVPEVSE